MEKKLESLSRILKAQGDLVLAGKAKLCLQLDEVLYLNKYQLALNEDFVPVDFSSDTINYILDFTQKAKAAKVCGDDSICEYLSFLNFKRLRYLEIYNLPIEIVTKIQFLKSRLRHLTLHRSCSDLCSFLVSEDKNSVWEHLVRANMCFNNISELYTSLASTIPYIRYLDLSHNQIRKVGNAFCGLDHLETLKLSFNLLEDIPPVSSPKFCTFQIHHNNIKMLDGLYDINHVVHVDLSGNCLEYLEQLSPLGHLKYLESLFINSNPVSFNPNYRFAVFKELNQNINADTFQLDGRPVSLKEFNYLCMPSNAIRTTNTSIIEHVTSTPKPTASVRSRTDDPGRRPSRKVSRQKIKLDSDPDNSGTLDGRIEDKPNVARSMQEKYGANWIPYYEERDSKNIVPERNISVHEIIDNVLSSSEDEEIPFDGDVNETPIPDAVDIPRSNNSPSVVGNKIVEPTVATGATEDRDPELDADDNQDKGGTDDSEHPLRGLDESSLDIDGVFDTGDDELTQDIENDEGDDDSGATTHFANTGTQDIYIMVKNQSIREKDMLGQHVDTLDINCLTNFIDDKTNIKLYFNHASSTRQFRSYDFKTSEELREFLTEVESIWREVRDMNLVIEEVKCINCGKIMNKIDAETRCKICGSDMIANLADSTPPSSYQSAPPLAVLQLEKETLDRKADEGSIVSSISQRTSNTGISLLSDVMIFAKQTNFVSADHKLETYFDLELFKRDQEVICCYLFAEYAKYEKISTARCVLVVSNFMVYICKFLPNQKPILRCQHRLSNLKHLDIGLNNQYFRLEWPSRGASYKILVYDSEKCKKFIDILMLAIPKTTLVNHISNSTISAINELVFGIDKTFELVAKAKAYHSILGNMGGKNGIIDRTVMFKVYPKCIPGTELVDWLVAEGECDNRALAVDLCQQLLSSCILQHVKYEEQFYDDYTLYRFVMDEEDYSGNKTYEIVDNENSEIVWYQLCYLLGSRTPKPISLIISNVKIFLTHEYHQWPLPRLQAPLPHHLRGQHFQVLHEIDLADVTLLQRSQAVLTVISSTKSYDMQFSSTSVLAQVENKISTLWEEVFGFPLERQSVQE